jgi:hypothetical protein
MTTTARQALFIAKVCQQKEAMNSSSSSSADGQQQGQQLQLLEPFQWVFELGLLVECLLLVPDANMASSSLQLMTLLLMQVNAAMPAEGATTTAVHNTAKATLMAVSDLVLQYVGAAVYHCMQGTDDLKQRRQLLRQWAELVETLMQHAGGWGRQH